jgi:pyridoxine 5-phosphate synthase
MTKLSVNINKIATAEKCKEENTKCNRSSRKNSGVWRTGNYHPPRPDERHITRKDVYDLKPLVTTNSISKEILTVLLSIWFLR